MSKINDQILELCYAGITSPKMKDVYLFLSILDLVRAKGLIEKTYKLQTIQDLLTEVQADLNTSQGIYGINFSIWVIITIQSIVPTANKNPSN